jgi:transcriptional regulator with XRE-family HTH domain
MQISQPADKGTILAQLSQDVERLGSQKALAEAIGVSAAYLSDVLNGNRDIGPSILRFYGLREETSFVPVDREATS